MYGVEGGRDCPVCPYGQVQGDASGEATCQSCDAEVEYTENEWEVKA